MIIYKDIVTGDELFSDAFKIETDADDFIIKCHGKLITRQEGGVSAELLGANPSQEEQQEDCEDSATKSGLDVVLNHELEDVTEFFEKKKAFSTYIKKWAKIALGAIEDEESKKKFKNQQAIMDFINLYDPDNHSVYAGAKFDPGETNSSLMIGVWSEDGSSTVFHAIKPALNIEKF